MLFFEKQEKYRKNIYFCFTDYITAFNCMDHNELWKGLKEMGIPDHYTCLLKNLYAGQKAIVRTRHGIAQWFQIRKGVCQGCILSSCLFNLCRVHHVKCWAEWNKLESRLLGEISVTSDMQIIPPWWLTAKRNQEPLDEAERREWKSWLNTQHSEK